MILMNFSERKHAKRLFDFYESENKENITVKMKVSQTENVNSSHRDRGGGICSHPHQIA